MRRFLVVAVFAVAILGVLAPPVFAQAPAPPSRVPRPLPLQPDRPEQDRPVLRCASRPPPSSPRRDRPAARLGPRLAAPSAPQTLPTISEMQ